jgi:hypothetical protein
VDPRSNRHLLLVVYMQITVEIPDQDNLSVVCGPSATVKELKRCIKGQKGHLKHQQRVLFNGRELQDWVVLSNALQNGSVVTIRLNNSASGCAVDSVDPCTLSEGPMLVRKSPAVRNMCCCRLAWRWDCCVSQSSSSYSSSGMNLYVAQLLRSQCNPNVPLHRAGVCEDSD